LNGHPDFMVRNMKDGSAGSIATNSIAGSWYLDMLAIGVLVILLQACGVLTWSGDAPPPARTATGEKSSRGNPPSYEVLGRRYYVMNISYG
jgi:hypothetical protein